MTSARTNWYAARLASERKSAVEHKFHEPVGNGPLPDRIACKSCGYISCGCKANAPQFAKVQYAYSANALLQELAVQHTYGANELRLEIAKALESLGHLDLSKLPHPVSLRNKAGQRMCDYVQWYERSSEYLNTERLGVVLYNLRKYLSA